MLALLVLACTSAASAQDIVAPSETPPPPAPVAHTSTAPELKAFVPAPHPEGHEGEASSVLLTIVVGADGSVESVEVAETGGEAFDEAALAAARAFHFTPATRDGEPIRARIRYRYVFTVTTVQAPSPEPTPVEELASPEPEPEPAPTTSTEVTPELADRDVPSYSATGVVRGPPRDGLVERVEGPMLTQMAGTRGDALRAVELLPGVGRPSYGLGVLLVRGAAPQESQYFLGAVPVPLPYHFGGLTSFFQSRLLSGFDLMLSNFGVRYGRVTAAILQMDVRDPRTDRIHGHADVNVIDASASIEGPISRQLSIAIAVRRSYIDAILGALNIQGLGVAPAYYDYQAIVAWNPDAENRVRLMMYGSDDQLVPVGPQDVNAQGAPQFGFDNQFHRVQLEWRHLYSPSVSHEATLSLGYDYNQTDAGNNFRQDRTQWPIIARSEWNARFSPALAIVGGFDLQILPVHFDLLSTSPIGPTQNPAQLTEASQNRTTPVARPAIYLEAQASLARVLDVVVGGRVDAYTEIGRATASPRLSTRWHLVPELDLRAAVGLFSQPPDAQLTLPNTGSPNLGPQYALHTNVGLDIHVPDWSWLTLRVDGFVRYTVDRAVGPGTNNGFGGSPIALEAQAASGITFGNTRNLTNDGIGRAYGGEVGVQLRPGGPIPLIGFLSYTLMRSELQDHPGQPWHLSPFDQTHILTLALTWMIGSGFELGATLRVVSGNPYTPVVSSVANLGTGGYRPIYGDSFSGRLPTFNRLDVRFSKTFTIGDVRLTLYIDVQNVYNNQNPEAITYNYDYSQTHVLPGLPIIPSLGLRGEL